ncbi:MAG: ribonuclease R [Pirellulaceae bacterium]|nr:ribonuclease R [Pirellulaceae bacterium]
MSAQDLERLVLRHISRPNYRPVKPRVIAKQIGIHKSQHQDLKRAIKKLAKRGELRYGKNHLVEGAGSQRTDEVLGTFRRNYAGYGFVRPKGTKRAMGRADDIFIPAVKTKDAATGDLVRVRTSRRRTSQGGSKISGEILQVVERGVKQFVGTYFERSEVGLVQIDGGEFPAPIAVGDPGAKNAQPDDKVVIELIRYPSSTQPGEGVITEVLGKHGQPGVDTLTVLRQFCLPDGFPEEVLEVARGEAEAFDPETLADRTDLTATTVITIDPADARDFDDAISLEKLENGHFRLGVHIADVSHFVKPNTALDREARDRATSVYLPDRVIPMIPEIISNHLASLQPDQVRFTKTAFIEFTADGARVATDFCSAAIKSKQRFSYEEVDDYLENPINWHRKLDSDVFNLLKNMYQLAMILRKRRHERGSIELSLPEIKIKLDSEGKVKGARKIEHTESHQIIEEFMLAANEAVAERLSDDQLPFLRRVHETPDPKKLATLTEFVRELGIPCDDLQNRFEIQRVLQELNGASIGQAVNYAVLRSMQKAVYSPQDSGHYALAAKHYCHFTSPIRRYPDLTIHRLMDSIIRNKSPHTDADHLMNEGEHCSQREQRAEAAERELIKLKLLNYFSKRIGETMKVVITGVEDFGVFAQGVEIPAEGLIHVDSLPPDDYYFDGSIHALIGHREENSFRLGDLLKVRIARVDLDRRELDFDVIEKITASQTGPQQATKQRQSGGSNSLKRDSKNRKAASKNASRSRGKGKRKKRR